MSKSNFTVGDYLLERLSQIGVRDLFGVPGDYNLAFLDHVQAFDKIEWRGNANELNAAYATDGYARINGIGAFLTTFGVGELSAMNGISGSYAEYVPVVQIIGAPTTISQQKGQFKHHTLCDGNYMHFFNMYKEVTTDAAYLDHQNPCEVIDHVLVNCLRFKRPVCIVIPTDVAAATCEMPKDKLNDKIEVSSDQKAVENFSNTAEKLLTQFKSNEISVITDFLVSRFNVEKEVNAFLDKCNFPYATFSMGKGIRNESSKNFLGIYQGNYSNDTTRSYFENGQCVINIGALFTDSLTGNFTTKVNTEKMISIYPEYCAVGNERFENISMADAIKAIEEICIKLALKAKEQTFEPFEIIETDRSDSALLTQQSLWNMTKNILQKGDIIVAEQGTSYYGISDTQLPDDSTFIGQAIWGSIGYTLPAALGAQIAAPEKRVVLFIGDGSALMTLQEFTSYLKNDIHPVVFVLNNDGYSVERAINGPDESYNDTAKMDWISFFKSLNVKNKAIYTQTVNSILDLKECIYNLDEHPDTLRFIELYLNKYDYPQGIINLSKGINSSNNAVKA